MSSIIAGIEEVIKAARNGHMAILLNERDGGCEGGLIMPAQFATPETINFMARHARGLICLALTRERIDQLGLGMMSHDERDRVDTAFTISIEARNGVTTGISAADRARTISVAVNTDCPIDDLVTPGHVFPLAAHDGGVLMQAGHAEATVDVARLAGLNASGVLCKIINEDGATAGRDDLFEFAERHNLKIGTIQDLITYRCRTDPLVVKVDEAVVDAEIGGRWQMLTYRDFDGVEHNVLQKGPILPGRPTLVWVQELSLLGDMIGEAGPGRFAFQRAMQMVADEGRGLVLALGSSHFGASARPSAGQRSGVADARGNCVVSAQILAHLNVHEMELISGEQDRSVADLRNFGLSIVHERPLIRPVSAARKYYDEG